MTDILVNILIFVLYKIRTLTYTIYVCLPDDT